MSVALAQSCIAQEPALLLPAAYSPVAGGGFGAIRGAGGMSAALAQSYAGRKPALLLAVFSPVAFVHVRVARGAGRVSAARAQSYAARKPALLLLAAFSPVADGRVRRPEELAA